MTLELGRRYAKAPIAEAVLDVVVETSEPVALEVLAQVLDESYTRSGEGAVIEAGIRPTSLGLETTTRQRTTGFRMTSHDGKWIYQARDDGFSFSQLPPYDSWSAFSAEGLRLWSKYESVVEPTGLRAVRLRYINEMLVEGPEVNFEDYLRTRPEISSDMPATTSGYFLTLDIPMPDHNAVARLLQTCLARPDHQVAIILDIAVQAASSDLTTDSLPETLETLRNAKNLVFEASITDKARSLFS